MWLREGKWTETPTSFQYGFSVSDNISIMIDIYAQFGVHPRRFDLVLQAKFPPLDTPAYRPMLLSISLMFFPLSLHLCD